MQVRGVVGLLLALVVFILTYAHAAPRDLGEAIMCQGRFILKPVFYDLFMLVAAFLGILGGVYLFKSMRRGGTQASGLDRIKKAKWSCRSTCRIYRRASIR